MLQLSSLLYLIALELQVLSAAPGNETSLLCFALSKWEVCVKKLLLVVGIDLSSLILTDLCCFYLSPLQNPYQSVSDVSTALCSFPLRGSFNTLSSANANVCRMIIRMFKDVYPAVHQMAHFMYFSC